MTDTQFAASAVVGVPARRQGFAGSARGLLAASRPRQWVKGVLVLAAPVAAGVWTRPEVLIGTTIALFAFTLTAAGCYLCNDAHDAAADRHHPTKRLRPVASGEVSVALASVVGALLVLSGPVLAFATDREELGLVVAAYGALTAAYSGGLKAVPGVEVAIVASGFVLRPLAGAAGSGVPPSGYFFAVCCAGALMVALGKRYAEIRLPAAHLHRRVLTHYSRSGLRLARTISGVALAVGYLAWALTRSAQVRPLSLVSAVAVFVAVYRFMRQSELGEGAEPERLLVRDPALLASAVVWAGCLLASSIGW